MNTLNSTQLFDLRSRNYHFPTLFPEFDWKTYIPLRHWIAIVAAISLLQGAKINTNALAPTPGAWCPPSIKPLFMSNRYSNSSLINQMLLYLLACCQKQYLQYWHHSNTDCKIVFKHLQTFLYIHQKQLPCKLEEPILHELVVRLRCDP